MKLFTFKLSIPDDKGNSKVALVAHNEEEARLKAIQKGFDLVSSVDEKKFINAFLDALNKKK